MSASTPFVAPSGKNIILLFVLAAVLLFAGLGASPIYILDEARNAQCAREMAEHNEWLVPTFNGELRPHKPPLHYYFMRLGYAIFGLNEFGARFFSAVVGFCTLLVTFFFTRKYAGITTALLSMLFLVSSTHFLFEFRLAVPDPYLIFFTTLSLFAFFDYIQNGRFICLLTAAIATGLAILTKGPVAFALPACSIFVWLMWERKLNKLLSWKMLISFIVMLIVAVPWYWMIHEATSGEFSREFFFKHNISRFSEPMEGHGGIFLLTILFVVAGLLPGSVFIRQAFVRIRRQQNPSVIKFCIVVVAVFVVFYCLSSTRLPNYPMPCYPFAAILLAYGMELLVGNGNKNRKGAFIILLCVNIILSVAAFLALLIEPGLKGMWWLASVVLVLPIITAIAMRENNKYNVLKAMKVIAGGYAVFNFIFLAFVYPAVYKKNPVTTNLHLIDPNKQLYAYEIYNQAFNFYVNKPIKKFRDSTSLMHALRKDPGGIIITRQMLLPDLDTTKFRVMASGRDLFERPTTVLLQLKP